MQSSVTLVAGQSFKIHGATITLINGGARPIDSDALPTAVLVIEASEAPIVDEQPEPRARGARRFIFGS